MYITTLITYYPFVFDSFTASQCPGNVNVVIFWGVMELITTTVPNYYIIGALFIFLLSKGVFKITLSSVD